MDESIFTNITLFPYYESLYIPQRLSDEAYIITGVYLTCLEYLLKWNYPKYFLIWIWTYTFFWTVTPLLGLDNYTYAPFGTSCTLNWHGRQTVNIIYNSLCLIGCYLVHVSAFIFCYAHVIRGYRKMSQATGNTLPLHPPAHESEQIMAVEAIISYHRIVSTSHLTKVSLTPIVLFLVAWTPYAAVTLWNIFSKSVDANVMVLPSMFAKISCACNPIVYGFISDHFRQTARRLILKKVNKEAMTELNGLNIVLECEFDSRCNAKLS